MNELLNSKLKQLDAAQDYECWYLVKQPTEFCKLCYLVSILKEYQDKNSVDVLQNYIETSIARLKSQKSDVDFSNNYRALRVAAFFGLITMDGSNYKNAHITPTYYEIAKRCNNEFEKTDLYGDIIDRQIEKMFLSSEVDEAKDSIRKDFRLYPVSGTFGLVAVKDISRFARNTLDFLQGIRYLKSQDIRCEFVNTNLSSMDSKMILVIMASLAQEESSNTSKRIKFSKKLNAEKGKVPNLTYGYDKTIGDYFNLDINPYEADVIRWIYKMYTKNGYGANKISKILNSEGITTKRGCVWTQNGISRILTNQLYIGKVINCKEEVKDFLTGIRTSNDEADWLITERPDLAIIDTETFENAQKMLKKNREAFHITGKRNCAKHVFLARLSILICFLPIEKRTTDNT